MLEFLALIMPWFLGYLIGMPVSAFLIGKLDYIERDLESSRKGYLKEWAREHYYPSYSISEAKRESLMHQYDNEMARKAVQTGLKLAPFWPVVMPICAGAFVCKGVKIASHFGYDKSIDKLEVLVGGRKERERHRKREEAALNERIAEAKAELAKMEEQKKQEFDRALNSRNSVSS